MPTPKKMGLVIYDSKGRGYDEEQTSSILAELESRATNPPTAAPDVQGLATLLEHARCNTCDGSGALYDGHSHVVRCQWCHERIEALAAHRKGGEA